MKSSSTFIIIFILSCLLLSLVYDYDKELLHRPHGRHTWRQCDGAQIALNYYNVDMNFFAPRLSLCTGNDGKMGSEFPIIYYLAACLYHLFGFHEMIIRIISLILFFTGLFYLFRSISLLLENEFYGLILSLMLFTSPLIIDYANNFLPDVPALSLSFIGLYYFLRSVKAHEIKSLWKSTFFFALAGLLKVTALMGFMAILGTGIISLLFKLNKTEISFWAQYKKSVGAFIFLPLLINVSWIIYIRLYNTANDSTYFLTTIKPIWEMTTLSAQDTVRQINDTWLREYMYRDFLNALPIVFLLSLILPAKDKAAYVLWLVLLTLESAAFLLLFYGQFYVHDYYAVTLMVLPPAVCAVFLLKIKHWKEVLFNSNILKAGVATLLVIMIYQGWRINKERDLNNDPDLFSNYYNLEPELNKMGIKKEHKVISIGDGTTGVTLYFMNRRGWTSIALNKPALDVDFEYCISHGAKYAVINKNEDARVSPEAREHYLKHLIRDINGMKFYKL